jgi:hypothetical protein
MATFSTKDEALTLLEAVREHVEQLPVAAVVDLQNAVSALHQLAGAIASIPLVDPTGATGTARYREVHSLDPIESEEQ